MSKGCCVSYHHPEIWEMCVCVCMCVWEVINILTNKIIYIVACMWNWLSCKFNTNNFIYILYFNIYFKLLFKNLTFYIWKLHFFDFLCHISFKENLPKDGHNRWPKHVGGYALCNTIHLRICMCTCWPCFS